MNTVNQNNSLSLWERLYRYHYGVGVQTLRLCRRVGRWVARVTRPLRRWVNISGCAVLPAPSIVSSAVKSCWARG